MAFFDWLFGEDDPDPVTYAQTSVQNIPGYIKEASERAVGEAERLAGLPYTPYEAPRVAGLTPETLAAFQSAQSMYGTGAGQVGQAYDIGIGSARPITAEEINSYLNPYVSSVAGIASEEVNRQSNQARLANQARSAMSGSFGGIRPEITDVMREEDRLKTIGNIYTTAGAQGYQTAIDTAMKQRESEARAGALGGDLAAQQQNLGYQDINTQLGIGALQQQQGQANLDVAYQDFLRQQQYPYERLNALTGTISGVPYETSSAGTTQGAGQVTPGFFQQAAGLGIAGLGTAGNLGWKPFA